MYGLMAVELVTVYEEALREFREILESLLLSINIKFEFLFVPPAPLCPDILLRAPRELYVSLSSDLVPELDDTPPPLIILAVILFLNDACLMSSSSYSTSV